MREKINVKSEILVLVGQMFYAMFETMCTTIITK